MRVGQKMNLPKSAVQNKNPIFSRDLISLKSIATWFGLFILRIISLLPYKMLMVLGSILGRLLYRISPHRRQICRINIERCLGLQNEQLDKLVKLNFEATGRGVFETALAWWSSDNKISNLKTNITNGDILKNSNEGVLVLIKHSTHLELDLRLLANFFDLTGMFKNQTNQVINYVMIKARNNYIKGSLTNKEALRALRWIRNGENFVYAADQDYGSKVSASIPFFSYPAATVTFPALLSKKGTQIIMADVSKLNGTYEIDLRKLENFDNDHDFLTAMNLTYEEYIKKEPEGYLWTHRRFKTSDVEAIYPNWSSRDKKRAKRRLKRELD